MRKNVIWKETECGRQGYTYREIVLFAIVEAGTEGITVSEIIRETGLNEATVRKHLKNYENLNRIFSIQPPSSYGVGLSEKVWKMKYYATKE